MSFLAQDIYFTRLLTLKKHLFKYILITMKTIRRCTFHIFIKKLHFMRITTKFGSQELDLQNSTYVFSKLHENLKINELSF